VAGRGDRISPGGDSRRAAPRGEDAPGRWVLLGEFGRAQGLRGEIRLKSFTGDPAAIAGYGPLATDTGRTIVLTHARPAAGAAADMLVVRVEGVSDRSEAEALNRTRLFVERERLAPAADEDEFLLADLVGLAADDAAGRRLGRVVGVPNYGGGDLIELRQEGGRATALFPFTKEFVPLVDIAGGRLVVAAGDDIFAPPEAPPPDADA
jgi:16S rRNA processing protein RimM